jgi:hypothetical protein
MQIYIYNNSAISDKLVFRSIDSLQVEFEFIHTDNDKPTESYSIKGIADNIDPDGGAAFEEFDPSGQGSPMELYSWEQNGKKLLIIIPLVTVDYVGIEYQIGNNEKYIVTLKE